MSMIQPLEPRRLLATVLPAGFSDQAFGPTIASGTAMTFAPDGRLFVLSQDGVVRVLNGGGAATAALTLSVNRYSERGLLGIALSPNFVSDGFVYLYYTERPSGQPIDYQGPTTNRVSRFTMSGNTINPASEQLILRLETVTAGNHNGGGMHFGPDGKLYIGVGENAVPSNAQSLSNRLGKLLRLNPDGSIPADNPTIIPNLGTPSGVNRSIYAAGLRNPYTFAFRSSDGMLLINDVGQSAIEEINLGSKGWNYGWPATEGPFDFDDHPNFAGPIYAYEHGDSDTQGQSITGGTFYESSADARFADVYQGRYFFGDYVNQWINVIDPANPPSGLSNATPFATGLGRVVDIDVGPDGALYYLQRGNSDGLAAGIHRIVADARPTVSLTRTGTLYINGTAGDDQIVVSKKNGKLRVTTNGVASNYVFSRMKRGNINAANGNDRVTLGAGVLGVTIEGGAGNDTLAGGDFADLLIAGDGDDRLEGNGGRDTLDAGSGRDTLFGGSSIDRLIGGGGRDRSDFDRRERRSSIEILI